ncbi:tripartite tricarboxylate transporter substrate binding protein [Alkalihalobacillus oceani]|uniref:Tripartite tricarboxylate transporter substrate binding protein n=1 Tax=Halalkalibacter oceani TaxID=1653776 RepID=A0A9X2IQE2_9BACI|nr:tripartite tricarboxylate transporter substrate binding protein [Halalkalibacter oceani]
MKKNSLVLFVLSLALLLGLAACGGEETATDDPAQEEGPAEQEEEEAEDDASGEAVDYPTRNIDIVNGWGAGGGTDLFSRAVAQELQDILGVSVNVINQPGSSGAIGTDYYMNTPADGYTLYAISAYTLSVASGNTPHGLENFRALARFQADTTTVQTLANGELNTWEKFVEAAKANPGGVSVGGTGVGATDELFARQMEQAVGIELNYVGFDDAGSMHAALLGGHIDAMMEEPGPTISYLESGEMVMLNAWVEERLDAFPDVPTTAELGYPELTDAVTRGLIIHADVDDAIVDILVDALEEAYQSERYQEYAESSYLHINEGWLGPDEFYQKMQEQIDLYTEILESMG